MKRALATTNPAQIANLNDVMKQAGQAANQEAARRTFADHTARKANNTIRRKVAAWHSSKSSCRKLACQQLGFMKRRPPGAV